MLKAVLFSPEIKGSFSALHDTFYGFTYMRHVNCTFADNLAARLVTRLPVVAPCPTSSASPLTTRLALWLTKMIWRFCFAFQSCSTISCMTGLSRSSSGWSMSNGGPRLVKQGLE